MRAPSANDFAVDVETVGTFMFGKREMRDELKIQAEYRRMTDGLDDPGASLALVAMWMATLKTLMVAAPDPKWSDLEAMDPLDPETYAGLMKVFSALRAKEDSFRRGPASPDPNSRPANGSVGRVLVPPPVQPAAH